MAAVLLAVVMFVSNIGAAVIRQPTQIEQQDSSPDVDCAARLIVAAYEQLLPWLHARDVGALGMLFCASAGNPYLEYGSGGSTRMAVASKLLHPRGRGQQSTIVVEGSQQFLADLLEKITSDVQKFQPGTPPMLLTTSPFMGPVGGWSYPTGANIVRNKNGKPILSQPNPYASAYPMYSRAGQELMRQSALLQPEGSSERPHPQGGWSARLFGEAGSPKNKSVPELVLVDGRFRVACVLRVIKEWGDAPLILLDDFNERQRSYGSVLRFAKPWLGMDPFLREGHDAVVQAKGGLEKGGSGSMTDMEQKMFEQSLRGDVPPVSEEQAGRYVEEALPAFLERLMRDVGGAPEGFIVPDQYVEEEQLHLPSMGMRRGLWMKGLPKGQRDEAALDAAIQAFSFIAQ